MTRRIRDSRELRCLLGMLFVLALMIRIAIPTGFMPTAAPTGIVITVCTGMGQVKAFVPVERDGDQDRHSAAENPCTFAASLGGDILPPIVASLAPVLPLLANRSASRAIAHLTVHRLAAPPPPAIGPPARA